MSKLTRNPQQYYENFTEVVSKIDEAVEFASVQNAIKIGNSLSENATKFSSVSASGDEAVESLVQVAKNIGNQLNALATASNNYGSQIEPLYEKVQAQLKAIKQQEEHYKNLCKNGPDNQSDKYYRDDGEFLQELYDKDVIKWNGALDKQEVLLLDMCMTLKSILNQLSSASDVSISTIVESGFNLTIPNIIPFMTDDVIDNFFKEQSISVVNGKAIIGGKEYDIQYSDGNNAYINIDGQSINIGRYIDNPSKGINGYIISGMDGKKHIIYRQGQISGWDRNCNRAAAASIVSAFTSDAWEPINEANKTGDGIGYNQKKTSNYFGKFGLSATVNDVKGKLGNYENEILSAVKNDNYVMFHICDKKNASIGESGHRWTGEMHWVAILDYKKTGVGENDYAVFVSDSGGKNSGSKQDHYGYGAGWYPLSEFANLKIDHYTVIRQT